MSIKKSLFLYILIITFALLMLNINCKEFSRNPNLIQITDNGRYSSFNPSWHPDGKIYYLQSNQPFIGPICGSIRSIKPNGTNDTIVYNGVFDKLTISSDGRYIAIVTHSLKLYILEMSTDTLIELPTKSIPIDIVFSKTESKIYYLGKKNDTFPNGLYSIQTDGSNDSLLLTFSSIPQFGFDISKDSLNLFYQETLYSLTTGTKKYYKNVAGPVQFSMFNNDLLLYSDEGELFKINFANGQRQSIDAKPWEKCKTEGLGWSQDEKSIVFSSVRIVGEFENYNIWVLTEE